MGYPFAPNRTEKLTEMAETLKKMAPLLENLIDAETGKCVAGAGLTMADIRLSEVLTGYIEFLGLECLAGYPSLARLQRETVALPSIDQYLAGTQRRSVNSDSNLDNYRDNVNVVLGRK